MSGNQIGYVAKHINIKSYKSCLLSGKQPLVLDQTVCALVSRPPTTDVNYEWYDPLSGAGRCGSGRRLHPVIRCEYAMA